MPENTEKTFNSPKENARKELAIAVRRLFDSTSFEEAIETVKDQLNTSEIVKVFYKKVGNFVESNSVGGGSIFHLKPMLLMLKEAFEILKKNEITIQERHKREIITRALIYKSAELQYKELLGYIDWINSEFPLLKLSETELKNLLYTSLCADFCMHYNSAYLEDFLSEFVEVIGRNRVRIRYFGVSMPLISEYLCHINKPVIQG